MNPTDDDLDEDDESLTVDGSRHRTERDGGDGDDQRRRHGRGDSQPNNVVGGRGRKLELHGGVDLAADRQRDGDTVAYGQFGRDGQFVAVDVHADQLVDSADGDGRGGGGYRRVERHGDGRARGQRGGLRDGDGGFGGGDGGRRRDSVDGGGAVGGSGDGLGERGGDHDHGHSNVE